MIIVVDVNIFFSALISPNNRLAKLLTHPNLPIQRISCHYAVVELFKHQPKIVKYAKKSVEEVIIDLYDSLREVKLYNETFIEEEHWIEAERLTSGVDNFDINYVALALHTGAFLWTGDKKLATHLQSMGYDHVITTEGIYQSLENNFETYS